MDSQSAPTGRLNDLRALFNGQAFEEAELQARSLMADFPLSGEAWLILGAALQSQGKAALPALKRAVSLMPGHAEAHFRLGIAQEQMGRLEAAEDSYRQALILNTRFADVHCFLGETLRKLGSPEEAIESFSRALAINPVHEKANHCLRFLYSRLGRLVEAEALCRRTLALKPDFDELRQCLSTALAHLSNYEDVARESDRAMERWPDHKVMWEQRLYCFSYHPDLSGEDIFKEFVRWGDRFPDASPDFSDHDRNPERRLRIGYVSPDFRSHSSRFYFWPLFSNHDRASFELFAYSNVEHEARWTRCFREQFEHWRDIRGVDDEEVARLVREDRIDILVDLCGHMEDERLGVFTLKPAPVQATWLGSAWTTGLKAIDYAMFDPFVAPEGTLARETIYRLPHSFLVFQPDPKTADLAHAPCTKNGHVTFGYSGRTERLNHRIFKAWGDILKRLPDAKLILDYPPFADPATQAYYRDFLSRQGVDTDRVIMRRSPDIFEGLNDIDILLDSFPHGGGTMLMDALWMGVPFVTLASRPPVGRLGTGMLMNLGLPEWVATSEAEYVEKACRFAGDPQGLDELRLGMRKRMQASPLMDGPSFARGVEDAYRYMFDTWLQKHPLSNPSNAMRGDCPGGGTA
ncbi:MAG: tetratricopeptide repeat protein [Geothrix sp.]|uniref:O-linked N-acetylglucosamine transferase, SPINDLY family protein n=1 Tax=Geothrix sp. TaxID=1962974 RepID=UPI00178DBD32|nr:tetratricopeptide repeat protein [Geothrix sp.]NWJ41154.1 tetratricopeptide repeat protein [Geothrix sp.]WIL20854.1 MAG: tetratricopeptide repeat protein [Geothrix sp.]